MSYVVVGLTEGEVRRFGGPVHRLKDCLTEQLDKVHHDVFAADIAMIYAVQVNGAPSAGLAKLYDRLPSSKSFAELLFLNSTACAACDRFGIPVASLGTVTADDVPSERRVALERPYFPKL